MAVNTLSIKGKRAGVQHRSLDDPLWRMSYSFVELLEDPKEGILKVKVGTPLACPKCLSNLEVQSVVQLITGREVRVGEQPVDTCTLMEDPFHSRCWKTYELTWP